MTGTLHEDLCTFTIISRSVLVKIRNASDKSCRENQNTHSRVDKSPPPHQNHAIHEIMWKKYCRAGKAQMTIWCMRTACWITNATETHSECVILIAFPLQNWFHERASVLRYTYVACLVKYEHR
jgi:hypothetical protein